MVRSFAMATVSTPAPAPAFTCARTAFGYLPRSIKSALAGLIFLYWYSGRGTMSITDGADDPER
ncbi:MAG: hypothetical protein WC846_02800 [Candidatus Gracilibacteria bacterium]